MDNLISRQAAIDALMEILDRPNHAEFLYTDEICEALQNLPSAQPERLTDDDFETIRIHLLAYKERLCNQWRWDEAEEYQRIIDRFMSFASAQPDHLREPTKMMERRTGRWYDVGSLSCRCSACGCKSQKEFSFCPNCGADMREGEVDETD